MLQAYIGIVSREGLELLCPENPETVRFLWRRVQREAGRVACFWSVVADESATLILSALRSGFRGEALALLQRESRECGLFVPSDEERLQTA